MSLSERVLVRCVNNLIKAINKLGDSEHAKRQNVTRQDIIEWSVKRIYDGVDDQPPADTNLRSKPHLFLVEEPPSRSKTDTQS